MNKKKIVLSIILIFTGLFLLTACKSGSANTGTTVEESSKETKFADLKFDHSMDLQYAENFSVDYYEGGYALISIDSNTNRFMVVPEDMSVPTGLDKDIIVLKRPIKNIYLVATSAMAFIDALDSVDTVRFSGAEQDSWYIDSARESMKSGDILYAGKYNEPDYELLLDNGCTLSIQSGMILHSPDVKEKLEELGIDVLMDRSSYENHPLGRTEWIKLYSVLLGKEEQAEKIFEEQASVVDKLEGDKSLNKTVVFFYINSSGNVVTRKSSDYVSKMIELAGGTYIFDNLGDPENATSTVSMEMEKFYATAKDADFIIYNSTIAGEVGSIDELVKKNGLLADFKAVKEGNVWCTDKNIYQSTDKFGNIILEINKLLTSNDDPLKLTHFYKLK